jgi:hypothetical protein
MDGSAGLPVAMITPEQFFDRVAVYSTTVGTGPLTLGGALNAYQTFEAAGVPNGQTVRYVIVDGAQWEVGAGVFSNTDALSRGPQYSSNGNAAINCDGSQAVFLAPTSQDWANIQSGWLFDAITGATAGQTGYVTRTGNEIYSIQPIPSYGSGLTFTGGVVSTAPLVGDVIAASGGPTSIYFVGMLNAISPLSGSELFTIYQNSQTRSVSALNVMMNIPGYTAAALPLVGTELMPMFQGGINRSVAASALMLNIPGYISASTLIGPEQFVVFQAGRNTNLTWTNLSGQILGLIENSGIPAQMVVGQSVITQGADGYILYNNNGTLANMPNVGVASGPTPPANPQAAGAMWWDSVGAQLYVWTGAQWVIAVNPPGMSGSFLPITGGTLTGPLVVPTVTIGVSSSSTPAPLAVGGQGLTFLTLGAIGQNLAFGYQSGQMYLFQAGVNVPLGYLPLAGGTLTGTLTQTGAANDTTTQGRTLVGAGLLPSGSGGLPLAIPAQAVAGNAIMYQPVACGAYLLNGYWDGANTRQLPGTGTGQTAAPQGVGLLAINGTTVQISAASAAAADNAIVSPLPLIANFNTTSIMFTAPLSVAVSTNGNVAAFVQNNASDCQIYISQYNHEYVIGNSFQTGWFYIADVTNGSVMRLGIDPNGGGYFYANFECVWSTPVQGNNAGFCGAPGLAWNAVCAYDFAQQSDPRGKRDVAMAPPGALDKVKALDVITYRNVEPPPYEPPKGVETSKLPRPNYDRHRIGFDASEIQKIYPDAASVDESGAATGYSLADMNALLWQAVQELSAKVAALEARR